jgi:hypothetical protein
MLKAFLGNFAMPILDMNACSEGISAVLACGSYLGAAVEAERGSRIRERGVRVTESRVRVGVERGMGQGE